MINMPTIIILVLIVLYTLAEFSFSQQFRKCQIKRFHILIQKF